ncbi:MAG: preprotein translocase subunit SecG [Candidatus Eremiobacteraeota bacterium]|nr:preprotein translocase subunit SecG [Candidatus Eremiobacteraeota bacterium]
MSAPFIAVPILLAAAGPAAAVKTPTAINMTPPPLPQVNYSAPPVSVMSQTPLAQHAPWLTHTLAGIFVFLAVALVVLLAFQTTKQEGLSGTIGGRVESAYRPRLGFDQQLARTTSWVAIAFAFFGFLVSLSGI